MITGSTVFSYFLVYLLIGFVFLGILFVYEDKFGMDELFGVSYYLINNFLLFILKKLRALRFKN